MNIFIPIILIFLLATVTFQDFKNRAISWFLIPLLFIGFIANALLKIEINELLTYFGINLLLIITNLLGVTLLISIKEKKIINIIDSYIGLGDILFFLIITVVFSPINFIAFYLGSILITTLIYGGIILLNKQKKVLVPLAGVMSIFMVMVLIADQSSKSIQLYQDFIF